MILLYVSTIVFSFFSASLSFHLYKESIEGLYLKEYYNIYLRDVDIGKQREKLMPLPSKKSLLKEVWYVFLKGAFIAFLWCFSQAAFLFVIHYFFKLLLWIKLTDLSRFSTFGGKNGQIDHPQAGVKWPPR
jgi:hypothetical protein